MSKSGMCCPVCGSVLETQNDYMDYTLMESSSTCTHCRMHHYEFLTGNYYQRVGFCEWYWTSDYITPSKTAALHAAEEETRKLFYHPQWSQWEHLRFVNVADDRTALLVFADWLQEEGFPLNEQALRRDVAEWDALQEPFADDPVSVYTNCGRCKGTGQVSGGGGIHCVAVVSDCPSCDGTGRVEVDSDPTL